MLFTRFGFLVGSTEVTFETVLLLLLVLFAATGVVFEVLFSPFLLPPQAKVPVLLKFFS